MKRYLIDLYVESARRQQIPAPAWLVRLYLSIFPAPLGKTLRIGMVRDLLAGQQVRGKRVLDIGCGIGDLSFMLAAQGASAVGVELDSQKVASGNHIVEQWHFEGLRFVAGDATCVESMDLGTFDMIFCLALLEHVRDDIGLLDQVERLLRPGGVFVIEVPSAARRTIAEIEAADGHVRPGYLVTEMPQLLANSGFHVVNQRTMDPLGLNYYWCKWSRPGSRAQRWLFTALAPVFISLIRLTSALIERPGCELCFLAVKDAAQTPDTSSRYAAAPNVASTVAS